MNQVETVQELGILLEDVEVSFSCYPLFPFETLIFQLLTIDDQEVHEKKRILVQVFLNTVDGNKSTDGPSLLSFANLLGLMSDLKDFFHMNCDLD